MRRSPILAALFAGILAVFALGPAPERVLTAGFGIDTAEARPGGRGGGFRGGAHAPPKGARSRPARQARPRPGSRRALGAGRPSTRPAVVRPGRPGTWPGARPAGKPATRPATRPANRPLTRPIGRPGTRPPGYRPPGYRPTLWRSPLWRPPAYRPPYVRPAHWRWGTYHYYPRWGWYFTATFATSTLVYVTTLPRQDDCRRIVSEGETMYVCYGVLYRSTVYKDERVYEIVSKPEALIYLDAVEESQTAPGTVLQLTSPRVRGNAVLALQRELGARGYDIGTPDGVFGPATDRALRTFQADNGLPASGVLTAPTAAALGL
ncbi:MAG: peptidoglycan-binding protein [Pseudomonadota bacterium]